MNLRIPVPKATLNALRKGEKAIIEIPIGEIEYVCTPALKVTRRTVSAVVYQGWLMVTVGEEGK